jgi:hypothetical protein
MLSAKTESLFRSVSPAGFGEYIEPHKVISSTAADIQQHRFPASKKRKKGL